jgi:cyclase
MNNMFSADTAGQNRRFFCRVLYCLTGTLLLLMVLVGPVSAQVRTADPIKRGLTLADFPRFVQLANNVYGYEEIRQPGFTTVSLVVIGRDGVLLADGQGNVQATQTMLDKIRTLTPLPVRWYVMGSEHGDHTGGNAALPKDATILTRDSITGDKRTIDLGGVSADVLFLGRAHTGNDLMLHLPRERILFMSEAFLSRVFPAMRSAYPSEWVAVVNRALSAQSGASMYVPGHGFIEENPIRSREELVAFRDALVYVIAEVKRLHALGLSAADALAQANWGPYADWFIRAQQAPIAIRKIYEEIEGKLPPPVVRPSGAGTRAPND